MIVRLIDECMNLFLVNHLLKIDLFILRYKL
jgi:hypothetical protein